MSRNDALMVARLEQNGWTVERHLDDGWTATKPERGVWGQTIDELVSRIANPK